MTLGFYLAYASRSLRRGGQRSALAVVCVAFGVLSLVALQQLAYVVSDAMLAPPRVAQGGDLVLRRPGTTITEANLASLPALGIQRYSPVADTQANWLKTSTSGRATIVVQVLGVDPGHFPLYGEVRLDAPADATLRDVLRAENDAIITRDLVERCDLAVGDTFAIFGAPQLPPVHLRVAGVAAETPDPRGRSVYFNLNGDTSGVTHVTARHDDPEAVKPLLEDAGWSVSIVPLVPGTDEAEFFRFMLAGAGILGLLIGGIGVANTMQVLLARRTPEIATLKTLGYRQPHLLMMFGLEAILLGLVGSVLGAALGLVVANVLMNLISVGVPFLLTFHIRPSVVAGGLLVGVLTTLIFGLVAILRASHVRPSLLLREMTIRVGGRRRLATFALYAVLLILFGLLSSAILGSVLKGFGVVTIGIVGLLGLGMVLGAVLFVVVRVPMPGFPLLGMARRNLRHQSLRSIYALVALFVGVVAIGFAAISFNNANEQLQSRRMSLEGINVRIYGSNAEEAALRDVVRDVGADAFHIDYAASAQIFTAADSLVRGFTDVVGRREQEQRWNLTLTDSLDVSFGEAAYIIDRRAILHGLALGDTLHLRNERGEATVLLAGIYSSEVAPFDLAAPPRGLVVAREVALRLGSPVMGLQMSVAVDPDRVGDASAAIGAAVPTSVVIGKDVLAAAINALLTGVFWFVIALAGLALVAGAVLIANAVGLSMLERRRELGILKAVGYTSTRVLWTVLLENALLGLIGGGSGVLGLVLTILVVNWRFPSAGLSLGFGPGLLLVLAAMAFAIVSALFVAWHPTRVRPLVVLRGE